MFPQPTGDPSVRSTVLSATWSMFIAASTLLALRLYCRIGRTKQTWWDDYLLVLGWVFLATSIALQTFIFDQGYLYTTLGNDAISPANLASDSLMKLSLAATKTSFALTLIRLVNGKGWIVWVVVAITFLTDAMMIIHATMVWRSTCGSPPNSYTFSPCWDPYSGLWLNFVGSSMLAAKPVCFQHVQRLTDYTQSSLASETLSFVSCRLSYYGICRWQSARR
jgi:hypothetical protein